MLGRIVYCNNVSVEPWSRVRPRKGLVRNCKSPDSLVVIYYIGNIDWSLTLCDQSTSCCHSIVCSMCNSSFLGGCLSSIQQAAISTPVLKKYGRCRVVHGSLFLDPTRPGETLTRPDRTRRSLTRPDPTRPTSPPYVYYVHEFNIQVANREQYTINLLHDFNGNIGKYLIRLLSLIK